MLTTISSKDFSSLFHKNPKKKGKMIGNPPKVQQMPTATWKIPPEICQHFNKYLLSFPIPKLCDECSVLWGIYEYLILKIKPKCVKNAIWLAKVEKLEQKFLELYGWAKVKEAEIEEKTGQPVGTPFSYFREADKNHPTLFDRLRCKRILSNESYMQ